jgi:rhodanese-related sulfurtransferase
VTGTLQGLVVNRTISVTVDDLRERIGELDKNKVILEYCQVGLRGYVAARILDPDTQVISK